MSDTPETDHLETHLGYAAMHSHPILWEHSRKMERERDEARAMSKDMAGQFWRAESKAERYRQERDKAQLRKILKNE